MDGSTVVITGATGFVGSHLTAAVSAGHRVWALSRASPQSRGVTLPAGVSWLPVDVAEKRDLDAAFERIGREGGAEILVHLAGHYDFTGERNPEYARTNVAGMRNVLEAARESGIRDFVFASSVAACRFPGSGEALDEESPPHGDSPYAESKRIGERMLREYRESFRCWTVRFAALFSDWCEYEPLFRFIETWLSRHPRACVLAGAGRSAIPFLHIRDGVTAIETLLARRHELDPDHVILASPDGATSHRELFEVATAAQFGCRSSPVFVPGPLCRAGLWVGDVAGRLSGVHPFERPWMGRYIDLRLAVDASRSRARLGWSPRARLGVLRRLPFMIQNRKAYPVEWHRRNHDALRSVRSHENLRIRGLLEARQDDLVDQLVDYVTDERRRDRFPGLGGGSGRRLRAASTMLVSALVDSVRTGEKSIFRGACAEQALHAVRDGIAEQECCDTLDALSDLCVLALTGCDPSREWALSLYDHVTMTVQFGIDEVHEAFEEGA